MRVLYECEKVAVLQENENFKSVFMKILLKMKIDISDC